MPKQLYIVVLPIATTTYSIKRKCTGFVAAVNSSAKRCRKCDRCIGFGVVLRRRSGRRLGVVERGKEAGNGLVPNRAGEAFKRLYGKVSWAFAREVITNCGSSMVKAMHSSYWFRTLVRFYTPELLSASFPPGNRGVALSAVIRQRGICI